MMKSLPASIQDGKLSVDGENAFLNIDSLVWKRESARGVLEFFSPEIISQVKAIACEIPTVSHVPLSKWSVPELGKHIREKGLVATVSNSTLWRWLNQDAIKPWQYRTWIFPRDPNFSEKAGRVLDLYQGKWEGRELTDGEYIISADEKTSIQARRRIHPTVPAMPGKHMKVEHEYKRCGAWTYLVAWDVRQAKLFSRFEKKSGIVPFSRLVDRVMNQKPYKKAKTVYWVTDNGSSHRGVTARQRLKRQYPNTELVHTPVHASWLNQVEIYFSIVQRKLLNPNDFLSLDDLKYMMMEFERHYEQIAKPFEWKFTRNDLKKLMKKIALKPIQAIKNT